jgi:hypothetical protein
MARSQEYPDLQFVPPASFTRGRPGTPTVVVIHYTAGHEGPNDAEAGAAYDGRRTDGTSAHYYHDSNSTVQCVYTWDRSHTALYNGNAIGIHHELAGTRQSRAQWLDAVSDATLWVAAKQVARDCQRYGIRPYKLDSNQVRAGAKGICGHVDITYAFPEDGGDHIDPGPEFPWDVFISRVRFFIDGGDAVALADMLKEAVPGTSTGHGNRTFGSVLSDLYQLRAIFIGEMPPYPNSPMAKLLNVPADVAALKAEVAALKAGQVSPVAGEYEARVIVEGKAA